MRAAVVSGVYATPVVEFSEHVFDFVTLSVQRRIVRIGTLGWSLTECRWIKDMTLG